jgi:xylan 1,4-beta-xylosidase
MRLRGIRPCQRRAPVYLGVDVRLAELQFRWPGDGVTWIPVRPVLDVSILSDEAGPGAHDSFTGALVGMAAHDMTDRALPADFDFLAYRNV